MIKSDKEIELMRTGGQHLGGILKHLSSMIEPGISTATLNTEAERLLKEVNAKPAFKGYTAHGLPPYPCSLCTSINEEIVHGVSLPGRILKAGDIVGLDLGLVYPAAPPRSPLSKGGREKGMYLDAAVTVPVGKVSAEAKRLIKVTAKALGVGLSQVKAGNTVGGYGAAVQRVVEQAGLSIVRDLVGHGVGRGLHEPPHVPNHGTPGQGETLVAGMTIAFEPMVTLGNPRVRFERGSWRTVTADGSLSAHFEHTALVTQKGHEVLTKP